MVKISANRRTVFEQTILSLLRVPCTFNTSEETVRLLAEVLDNEASLLEPLDGMADQYCARKVYGHNHNGGCASSFCISNPLLAPSIHFRLPHLSFVHAGALQGDRSASSGAGKFFRYTWASSENSDRTSDLLSQFACVIVRISLLRM